MKGIARRKSRQVRLCAFGKSTIWDSSIILDRRVVKLGSCTLVI